MKIVKVESPFVDSLIHNAYNITCQYQLYPNSTEVNMVNCDKEHQKSVHDGVKYPCKNCNYQATTMKNLKRHKKSVHDGVKYPCKICSYEAAQKGHLKEHQKSVHDGVKYP